MNKQNYFNKEEVEAFIADCKIKSPSLDLFLDTEHRRHEDQRLMLEVDCVADVIRQGHISIGPLTWHTLYLMKNAIENAHKSGVAEGLRLAAERLDAHNRKLLGVKS